MRHEATYRPCIEEEKQMRPRYLDVAGVVTKRILLLAGALVLGWILGALLMLGMAGGCWWLGKRCEERKQGAP